MKISFMSSASPCHDSLTMAGETICVYVFGEYSVYVQTRNKMGHSVDGFPLNVVRY